MLDIENLTRQFALDNMLTFAAGPNGTVMINIKTPKAEAQISTYGAQVLSYKPALADQDMLFMSPASSYGDGKAIRGGVPICWPWFGDDPSGYGRPAHGFSRNQVWQVMDTYRTDSDEVGITLQLTANALSQKYWHCDFNLQLTVIIGDSLKIALTTENTDQENFVISQALHTYFKIGDIEKLHIRGLDNHHYLDKTLNYAEKLQQGSVTFHSETDRIYLHAPPQLYIEDVKLNRRIVVDSKGSQTTVVWNPWHRAIQLDDLHNDAYQQFVCVETANAADNSIELAPGQKHTLFAEYRLQAID